MQAKINYKFSAKLWKDASSGGWFFVSLPKDISKEIREHLKWQEEGWGRMKAVAIINNLEWNTAIWFDTKSNTYLLPVKAEIRKKAYLQLDDIIHVNVLI
ncbi:DUF1905 domain-containing protein [uncultured Algibacter sp.]|uniref:DUF1905 domain-containing protein n=1 Tax=uncultured Algibacter sp. TaxID=298659 RepID=UPI00261AA9FA|nr:DUF1905 domain-containing protein [uncultured Algibacter sp.]